MNRDLIERLWAEACRGRLGTSISERFAALIAKECRTLVEAVGDDCHTAPFKAYEDTHPDGYRDGCNDAASAIYDAFERPEGG